MPLLDYQFEYTRNDKTLLFGMDTDVDVMKVDGLLGMEARIGDRPFTRFHGDVPGLHTAHPRNITMDLIIRQGVAESQNDYFLRVEDTTHEVFLLRPEFSDSDLLKFKFPGYPEQFTRARTIRRDAQKRADTEWGHYPLTVQMRAADPRIYSFELKNTGAVSGTFNVTNDGKADSHPAMIFSQSGTVQITNNTTGQVMTITGQPSGTLVADMDAYIRGTNSLIIYIGSTSHYGFWTPPRRPFVIAPGVNSITLNTGTSVEIQYRDTWI